MTTLTTEQKYRQNKLIEEQRKADEKAALIAEQELDRKYLVVGPLQLENRSDNSQGIYYECDKDQFGYWEIFPKPIGYLPQLPDWLTSRDHGRLISSLAHQHRYITYGDLRDFRTITAPTRNFTPEELTKMLTESNTIIRRIRDINMSYPLLKDGLNSIGVRRFFETQVFSNPPIVELTPALLKPYILSRIKLSALRDSRLPSVKAILEKIVITVERGERLQSIKQIPLPIYSGLFHGDTCAGDVFLNMTIGYEQQDTFASLEERDAFFLQICKLLIAGIEKDAGHSHINDCDNHGNFGECLSGLFDDSSAYYFTHFRDNHFLKNRVIMLLFHKIIEVNEKIRRTIDMTKSQQAVTNFSLTSNSEFGKIPHYVKKAQEEALVSSTSAMTERTKSERAPLIALAERYFDIAISIMHNTVYSSGQSVSANPLNVELCAAEVELDPTAPDSAGLVRYVAKFVKPINPDGRTMAHLLAEECPRVLMRMMVDPAVKMKFRHDRETRFEIQQTGAQFDANPIAYLIADSRGETPKSLAMRKLSMIAASSGITAIPTKAERDAYKFFESLPEPQRDAVHVEREHFMKSVQHGKFKRVLSDISAKRLAKKKAKLDTALDTAVRKAAESRRIFEDASEKERLLTGNQGSMIVGMPSYHEPLSTNREGPVTLIKDNRVLVVPDSAAFGGGGCGCGMNWFEKTRKRSGRSRRHRKRSGGSGGGRKRTNGRSGRNGRIRKNTARKYRNKK